MSLLAGVCALLAMAGAARGFTPGMDTKGPASPMARPLELVSGYPAGEKAPLYLVIGLPPGWEVPATPDKGELLLRQNGPGDLRVTGGLLLPPFAGQSHKGKAVLQLMLLPEASARPGPRDLDLVLTVPVAGMGAKDIAIKLPVKVLAAGSKAVVHKPKMLSGLNAVTQAAAAQGAVGVITLAKGGWGDFAGRSLWLILAMVFLGGLGLNLTPCVYPLLPITISYFGGRAQGDKKRLMAHSLLYWAGIVITYTVLGAFVSLSGRILGHALTSPWVLGAVMAVMIAMAASMFGLWELRLPASLNRLASTNRTGLFGSLVMGLTLGVLAAPCVGPFVVALMTHVAQVGRIDYGLLLFFVLSLGLGLPLTVLAFFSGSMARLPGAGDWMVWVRKFFGVVLILMALAVGRPLFGDAVFRWGMILGAILGGLYLAFLVKGGQRRFAWVKKALGLLFVLSGLAFWWLTMPPPAELQVHWQPFRPAILKEAASQNKPVVIDFRADWCRPCKKMETEVFPEPEVVRLLGRFVPVKVDVTRGVNAEQRALMTKWGLRGVPSFVFIGPDGRWLKRFTLVGYKPAGFFAGHLKKVLAQGGVKDGG